MRPSGFARACSVFVPILALTALLLAPLPATAVVLQPGPGLNDGTDQGTAGAGKDSYAIQYSPAETNGATSECSVYNSPCSIGQYVGLLRFDLGAMPVTGIHRATVSLWVDIWHWNCGSALDKDPIWGLHALDADWNEVTVDWNTLPAWESTPADEQTIAGVAGVWEGGHHAWVDFDITPIYQSWAAGTTANYGLAVVMENDPCFNCAGSMFSSSDRTDVPERRPKLTVEQLLFSDDFSGATVGRVPPGWERKSGSWKAATAVGYTHGTFVRSSKAPRSVLLLPTDNVTDGPFRDGSLELRFKVGAALNRADVRFFFDSTGPLKERAVRIVQTATGWYLQIWQKGSYDGSGPGVLKKVKLTGFNRAHWFSLQAAIGLGGSVDVTLTDEQAAGVKWNLSGAFSHNSGASTGLESIGTIVSVDDYALIR